MCADFFCRHVMHKRKSPTSGPLEPGIPPLPSTHSIHDFHKFGVHPNSVAPGFHFHLAASINPDTGNNILLNTGATRGYGSLKWAVLVTPSTAVIYEIYVWIISHHQYWSPVGNLVVGLVCVSVHPFGPISQ